MPLWLRRTTFNMIDEFYKKEAEEYEKQQKDINPKSQGPSRPAIAPKTDSTYTTKAPKK
jgi:hypothetical protein